MIKLITLKLIVLISFNLSRTFSIDNGLGKTPPMGWNGWNQFRCDVNENVVKQAANKIIELGLDKKGYVYVNLDDCWQNGRQYWSKTLTIDTCKFPSGIKALADYMHSKELKLGIYSDAGTNTCEGRPGSLGYEKVDAQTFASWGVDFLKYDNCNNLGISSKDRYTAMSKALNDTGRAIYFSMCNWGQEKVWQWGNKVGNSWRTTGDIGPEWKSILEILDKQVGLQKYSGRGGWNDPDMLEIGNGDLTYDQSLTHFTMWCLLKAPLILGCDLQKLQPWQVQILSNQQLIAINQDDLCVQGSRVKSYEQENHFKQVWGGPLSKDRYVVVFFNRGNAQTQISVDLKKDLKLDYKEYSQRDPVRHKDIASSKEDVLSENVAAHGVEVRILALKKKQMNLIQE